MVDVVPSKSQFQKQNSSPAWKKLIRKASREARLVKKAKAHLVHGERSAAIELCRQALAIEPLFNKAHTTMAHALMPGAPYTEILEHVHEVMKPATYCEIGVFKGETLALALAETNTVGIDPNPRIETKVNARARLFPIESDTFFERYDLFEEVRNEKLDLAFIDGLHHFDQVLRDFINIERYASSNTVVLLHDVYPPTEISTQRERVTSYWAGDTWKIIPCLKETRTDLVINVIPSYPCGLGIITHLDNSATYLKDNLEEVTQRFDAMPFSQIEKNRGEFLNVTENSWENIRSLIGVSE
jgi:predicted O-methyltransferase YrrM